MSWNDPKARFGSPAITAPHTESAVSIRVCAMLYRLYREAVDAYGLPMRVADLAIRATQRQPVRYKGKWYDSGRGYEPAHPAGMILAEADRVQCSWVATAKEEIKAQVGFPVDI